MAPCVLYAAYVVCAALARVAFAPHVRATVWAGSIAAVALTAGLYAAWPRVAGWLARARVPLLANGLLLLVIGADLVQYGQWAAIRTYKNVTASTLVGQWLPPGTLVEGKLANGLALDNRIRPVFVGSGFGNDEDGLRPDVRYILTYTSPRTRATKDPPSWTSSMPIAAGRSSTSSTSPRRLAVTIVPR